MPTRQRVLSRFAHRRSGLIADGDNVFCLYDKGFASCVHAPTGAVRWIVRTDAAFSGSPVRVRDKIYCIDEEGVVWVIAADDQQYQLLAKNPLGEPSRSTPAVSGRAIYNLGFFCGMKV